jgi:hypothetical protein
MLDCSTLTNPPADCDKSCTSDSECTASFCSNGKCLAQCVADEGCNATSTCNSRGRCVPNVGTGGTSGTGGVNGCQSVTITPTRSIPNVMFLVDQSGSMPWCLYADNCNPQPDELSRWEAAHTAITSIVSELDSIVRFGLTTYTSDDGNDPCPLLPTQVDFALDSSVTIGDPLVYKPNYPSADGDETPTGDSIDALVSIIQNDPPPAEGPTIIVLATDGAPDTCEQPNPQDGQAEAVAAATAAHALGIDVFVLWVGVLADMGIESHLQDVANAGVGNGPTDPHALFWIGENVDGLEIAFRDIISASISCDVQMDEQFADVDKACDEGDVRLNGTPLSCPSEWRVKPGVSNVIELVGSACDTFKSGSSTFTAVFPCGAIVVQ